MLIGTTANDPTIALGTATNNLSISKAGTMTLNGAAALPADSIAAAQMADANHGDVTWSSGVASVTDFALTEDASAGNFNITNVGDINVDSVTGDDGSVSIGLGADNIIIYVDVDPDDDDTYSTNFQWAGTGGESITQWDAVYLNDTDNEYHVADNATAEFPVLAMCVTASAGDGSAILLIDNGIVENAGWSWTGEGSTLWLGTGGDLTETVPSGDGSGVQIIGWTLAPTQIRLKIDSSWGEDDGA